MQTRNGIWNLENVDLTQLVEDKAYEFRSVWSPPKINGGTGLRGNPVARLPLRMTEAPHVQQRAPRWPDRATMVAYVRFLLLFCVLFFLSYFATQWIAPPPRAGFHLYFEWERNIPLVPWMIWPYLTLLTVFSVPAVQFMPSEISQLSKQSSFCLLIGGLCFLAFPCVAGFPETTISGFYGVMFEALHSIDTPQNLVPSLHVAFSALILMQARAVSSDSLRLFYGAWLTLMMVCVVLTHQHHLADVLAGCGLAVAARRLFPISL